MRGAPRIGKRSQGAVMDVYGIWVVVALLGASWLIFNG